MRLATAALLLLAGPAVLPPAAAADPLRSPACQQALQGLARAEDGARDEPGAGRDRPALEEARRAVRRDCLGVADPPPPAPRLRPPVAVGSALPPGPVPPGEAGVPARPGARPPQPAPPLTVTSCDPAGCWASDGSRLQRQGSLLLGPRGPCTQLGNLLNCP